MPKKIVRTAWECTICGDDYMTRKEALACENKGISAPAVHLGRTVDVCYPNGSRKKGIVCGISDTFFTCTFYHDGPVTYMVCLENGTILPADRDRLVSLDSIFPPKQPPNVPTWDDFWETFRRNDPEMRKRVQQYLKVHGARYALRRGRLEFRKKQERRIKK